MMRSKTTFMAGDLAVYKGNIVLVLIYHHVASYYKFYDFKSNLILTASSLDDPRDWFSALR